MKRVEKNRKQKIRKEQNRKKQRMKWVENEMKVQLENGKKVSLQIGSIPYFREQFPPLNSFRTFMYIRPN